MRLLSGWRQIEITCRESADSKKEKPRNIPSRRRKLAGRSDSCASSSPSYSPPGPPILAAASRRWLARWSGWRSSLVVRGIGGASPHRECGCCEPPCPWGTVPDTSTAPSWWSPPRKKMQIANLAGCKAWWSEAFMQRSFDFDRSRRPAGRRCRPPEDDGWRRRGGRETKHAKQGAFCK